METQPAETCNEEFITPKAVQKGGRSRVSNAAVVSGHKNDVKVQDISKKVRRTRIIDSDSDEEESPMSQASSQKKERRSRR